MTTNLTIIEDALREINVIDENGSASAEQGSFGLRKLNQMMHLWNEQDMDVLGYFPQSTTTDTIPIPDWAELAVTTSLAIALAPKYGASISIELSAVAGSSYNTVLQKCIREKLDNTDMTHLPIGQGHIGDTTYNINTDIT